MADIATLISILATPKPPAPEYRDLYSRDLSFGDIVEDTKGKRAVVASFEGRKVFTNLTNGHYRNTWYSAVKVTPVTSAGEGLQGGRRLHDLRKSEMRGALIQGASGQVYFGTYGMGLQDEDGDEIYAMGLDGQDKWFDSEMDGVLLYQSEQATVTHETPATAEIRAKEDGC